MMIDITVHDSSGNIFEDMGMTDAAERLAKAEVAREIRKLLAEQDLTQEQAAERLVVSRPEFADLVRGRLARFSTAGLEDLLIVLRGDSLGSEPRR